MADTDTQVRTRSFSIDPDLDDWLVKAAEAEDRPVSNYLRRLIERARSEQKSA